jgi:hypothetical protein
MADSQYKPHSNDAFAEAAPQPRSAFVEKNPPFPQFLDTRGAAALLLLSPSTLNKWRLSGLGPRFRKLGRRIIYARSDLVAFADANARTSTSES